MADRQKGNKLPDDLNGLPQHVAIIMDGNGRWAKKRFLPRTAGHQAGVSSVRRAVEFCAEKQIKALTLFAFSSENWRRPKQEVSILMNLFLSTLEKETEKLHRNNIRVRFIGDRSAFSAGLQKKIQESEALTASNSGLNLLIAANYGGRWDMLQATQKVAKLVAAGELQAEEITEEIIQSHLTFADLPEPDLFIRTGGDHRISNFLLWQLAYTELYFTPQLWPDFDQKAMQAAIEDYAQRQRRFGHTGDQIEEKNKLETIVR